MKRAAAMPPLLLNPLEGLPGIDVAKINDNRRRRPPEED